MFREYTLAELDITRDEDGRMRPGFQVGKAAAMSDWLHKREEREFKAMCRRLKCKSYWSKHRDTLIAKKREARRLRAGLPAERRCESCGASLAFKRLGARYCCNRCRLRAHPEYKQRATRSSERASERPSRSCEHCGSPLPRNSKARFCGDSCRKRWHRVRRGYRIRNTPNVIKQILSAETWLTLRAIRDRVGCDAVKTVRRMLRDGELKRRGTAKRYEYSVSAERKPQ